MYSSLKRNIFPMHDWKAFLEDGKTEFDKLVKMPFSGKFTKDDFDFMRTLGMGGFGRVMLAKEKGGRKVLAIKLLEKEGIANSKRVKQAIAEKRILQALNHPFTVFLETSFQDNVYLFLALPFIEGGEMFVHLRRMRRFPEALTRFYAAQVLLAFEYLHYCDMIFRDLKPENILVDRRGYLKLTDFGFCKVVQGRTYTLCGTPEYIAPEIILSRGYGKAVDWWAYGVLLFELAAGIPPFHARDPMKIYERIVTCKYSLPKDFSQELSNLITNLLQVDLTRRYGNLKNGISDIKDHDWFSSINWISLFNLEVVPAYVPEMPTDKTDFSNFEKFGEFTLKTNATNPYGNMFDDF